MAETVTRTLPAQFIEDLGRDYGTQIAALTSLPVDTTKFAQQVAAQDALQTAAYQQATDPTKGLGSFQPFLTKAGTAADAATALTGTGAGTGAGSIQSYMSPYQSDVIDTTLNEFDRQAQAKKAAGGDLDKIKSCIKITGFVNSTDDFFDQPKVINPASELLSAVFGDQGKHARAAVSANSLPLGVDVEIDAIFETA